METIAFRIWDKERRKFWDSGSTPSMLKSFFEHTAVLHTRDEMPYQQYTGLEDKEKNWIYEGDIVRYMFGVFAKEPKEVIYVRCFFALKGYENDPIVAREDDNRHDFEVIGNIYESKHLLDK